MGRRSFESMREELSRLLPIAAVGIALGVTAAWIVLPQPVEPVDVPLPTIDWASLSPSLARDVEARAAVERAPLPAPIRAVGSAYYAWNEAAAAAPLVGNAPEDPAREALREEMRAAIGVARHQLGEEVAFAHLRTLRSYDAERFLEELGRDPAKDPERKELHRLSGALLDVLVRNGWLSSAYEPRVPSAILRIRYKLHWTSAVFGVGDCDHERIEVCYGVTTLALDPAEVRTLLAFLVAHPVVRPDDVTSRGTLEAAMDARRLVYIDRLAALDRFADPTGQKHPYLGGFDYALARAAMLYRMGSYAEAEQLLHDLVAARKDDGRARNWYLAAYLKNHPTD